MSFGASVLRLPLCVHASDDLVFIFPFLIIVWIIKSCTWIILLSFRDRRPKLRMTTNIYTHQEDD